jgi:hypothetical protein
MQAALHRLQRGSRRFSRTGPPSPRRGSVTRCSVLSSDACHASSASALHASSIARRALAVERGGESAVALDDDYMGKADVVETLGTCLVKKLQKLVRGKFDLFVPPFGCAVMNGNQPRPVQATEVSIHECVTRLRVIGGPSVRPRCHSPYSSQECEAR